MTKAERQKLWQSRITQYKAGGQNVTAWCAEHDVNPQQLWYWLRKEKTQAAKENTASWISVDFGDTELKSTLLVRVGQIVVEVNPGFDPKLLLDVANILVAQ
ncbi:MAG: helix-turn-helix domain-containing protein [Clostridia bacterium]|nr:helix-turn-helix domain-containing protein [Clostridia bacterium]